jgi:hypothetical protein
MICYKSYWAVTAAQIAWTMTSVATTAVAATIHHNITVVAKSILAVLSLERWPQFLMSHFSLFS